MAALALARAAFSYKINLSFRAKTEIDCAVRPHYNGDQDIKRSVTERMYVAQEWKIEVYIWRN